MRRLIGLDSDGRLRELIGRKDPIVRDMPRHLIFLLNVSGYFISLIREFTGLNPNDIVVLLA